MGVYDSDIATATELIDEFGCDVWFQAQAALTGGTAGYPTLDSGADAPALHKTRMAFFSPRDLNRGILQYLDQMLNTEVPENTQIGLLAGGQTFAPDPTQIIWFEQAMTTSASISRIDLVAPNGTPVLYLITVSR